MFAPMRPTPTKPMFMLSFPYFCHVERSRDISDYFPDLLELNRVRDPSTSVGMTKGLHTLPAKHGLHRFSPPTVVIAPCPGQTIVSCASVRILSIFYRSSS